MHRNPRQPGRALYPWCYLPSNLFWWAPCGLSSSGYWTRMGIRLLQCSFSCLFSIGQSLPWFFIISLAKLNNGRLLANTREKALKPKLRVRQGKWVDGFLGNPTCNCTRKFNPGDIAVRNDDVYGARHDVLRSFWRIGQRTSLHLISPGWNVAEFECAIRLKRNIQDFDHPS